VKSETVDRLCERGYSPASAELTSRAVMEAVREEWPDVDGGRASGGNPDDGVGANGGENPWD